MPLVSSGLGCWVDSVDSRFPHATYFISERIEARLDFGGSCPVVPKHRLYNRRPHSKPMGRYTGTRIWARRVYCIRAEGNPSAEVDQEALSKVTDADLMEAGDRAQLIPEKWKRSFEPE